MRDRSELRDACRVAELNVERAKAEVRNMRLENELLMLRAHERACEKGQGCEKFHYS